LKAIAAADVPSTGDSVRDKVRVSLAQALLLAVKEGAEGDAVRVGVAVEVELHHTLKGVSPAYKAKFRNLHFNLKDEKNPDLRRKVCAYMGVC
jgi:transcription elongation factor S-II